MTNRYAKRLARIAADTTKAQNADWLTADVQLKYQDSVTRISVAVNSAVKVLLSPSAGSNFYLNNGTALVANSVHTEDVQLDTERTWNMITDDAGGTDVTHLIITEIMGAS